MQAQETSRVVTEAEEKVLLLYREVTLQLRQLESDREEWAKQKRMLRAVAVVLRQRKAELQLRRKQLKEAVRQLRAVTPPTRASAKASR